MNYCNRNRSLRDLCNHHLLDSNNSSSSNSNQVELVRVYNNKKVLDKAATVKDKFNRNQELVEVSNSQHSLSLKISYQLHNNN